MKVKDISEAVIKVVIEWNKATTMWKVTLTRLNGSTQSWDEPFMQEATNTIQRMMETEESWP